jgi:chemotaxis signal transduction protein
MRSVLVFRIGTERLALDAEATHRVVPVSAVRRVPHRTNAVFAGIANVAGELTPVASIGAALGIASGGAASHFIVIGAPGARWAFAADAVEGVQRVDASRAVAAPTTVRHAADGCTDRLVPVACEGGETLVGVLDAARLAALLARSLA